MRQGNDEKSRCADAHFISPGTRPHHARWACRHGRTVVPYSPFDNAHGGKGCCVGLWHRADEEWKRKRRPAAAARREVSACGCKTAHFILFFHPSSTFPPPCPGAAPARTPEETGYPLHPAWVDRVVVVVGMGGRAAMAAAAPPRPCGRRRARSTFNSRLLLGPPRPPPHRPPRWWPCPHLRSRDRSANNHAPTSSSPTPPPSPTPGPSWPGAPSCGRPRSGRGG